MKWHYEVRNVPQKRLPAIVDKSCMGESNKRANWNTVGCVVEKYARTYLVGRNQEVVMSVRREVWEVQGRNRRKDERKGKASAKELLIGGIGKTFKDIRGIERRIRSENIFARPNGLRDNAETAISCR